MRNIFLAMLILLVCSSVALAEALSPSAEAVPAKSRLAVQVENVEQFFAEFLAKGTVPPKTDFETNEEYQRRLPPPIDPSKVVYIAVDHEEPMFISHYSLKEIEQFSYEIDSQQATIQVGKYSPRSLTRWTRRPKSVLVHSKKRFFDSYEGSNAFGVTRTVTKSETDDYVLNLINIREWPKDTFQNGCLKVNLRLPREQAKALSEDFEFIIGIAPVGYDKSGKHMSDIYTPTIDLPQESKRYELSIDVRLVKIILREKSTGTVLISAEVPKER